MTVPDLLHRSWMLVAAIVFLIGGLVYSLSFALAPSLGDNSDWVRLTKELGLSLMIAMITAVVLERLLHERLLQRVKSALGEMRKLDVLDGAIGLGVDDLLSRRQDIHKDRFEKRVVDALKSQRRGDSIRVACVAGVDMFAFNTPIGHAVRDALQSPHRPCKLRVLLICPKSGWTRIRNELERDRFTRSEIAGGIEKLETLAAKFGKENVDLKLYDCQPTDFLIITEEFVFSESYPLSEVDGSIGGYLPLLISGKNTETYVRWSKHFEYVWGHLSHRNGETCVPVPPVASVEVA